MTDLLQVLLDMRNGQVAADCNQKFNDVLRSVIETAGKGELTIKLFIKPSKLGMGGAVVEVETEHECKMRRPELSVGRSLFFVSESGDLVRDNPDQAALFGSPEKSVKNA